MEAFRVIFSNNFLKRFLSSLFLIALALYINFSSDNIFLFASFFVLLIIVYEYCRLFSFRYFYISFITNYILVALSLYLVSTGNYFLIIFCILLGISLSSLLEKKKFVALSFMHIYLGMPVCAALYLNSYASNGKYLVFLAFIIVWSSDIAGYLFGKTLKGPKLIPSISPNKTITGTISSLIAGGLACLLYLNYISKEISYSFFFIGVLLSFFSICGDLFESYLKRINNKKDSSNIIPGHGGLLDRLDGFLFVIVIICLFSIFKE